MTIVGEKLSNISDSRIVILDDVREMPVYGMPYISKDCIICFNHSGNATVEYDDQKDVLEPHDVAIVYPHHILLPIVSSSDYNATLVIVPNKMLESFSSWHSVQATRFIHELNPHFHLTDEQYKDMMDIIQAMRCLTKFNSAKSGEMMISMLDIMLTVLSTFYEADMGKLIAKNVSISSRLYEVIYQNCHQHHDVKFYADLFNLSPKYFSSVVKQETGHTAGHWISLYLVDEAKFLLRSQSSMTIQEISFMLGFEDQASFCRYFKNKTGESPSAFRRRMK
ncbi:MAG: helix-turn-helix domain-containing protein [Bacteroidales bacterium]|nr:helix-turn-helix domain-containing protein [Bacteroidales bacterium]